MIPAHLQQEATRLTDDQLADAVRKWLLRIDTQSIAQQIGVPECEEIAVVIGNTRLIFGYRGHTHRFFTGGPNWWQITFPPRWRWRFSIIHWRPK